MGKDTAISWCHHTHNPWWGCWKISPGCQHCYAAGLDHRLGLENWERGGPRRFFKEAHWNEPLRWNRAAERAGERRRVFCASMADICERHPDPSIATQQQVARERTWDLVRKTPALDWLFLTKRPEEAPTIFPWVGSGHRIANAWFGVTAENDEYARRRLPLLQAMRPYFAQLFVSYEPAIGRIDWTSALLKHVDWVIFGDESGNQRRAADPQWARETRDACAAAGVAFHFKQWCGVDVDGITGKRVKGKFHLPVLDGITHDEFPN